MTKASHVASREKVDLKDGPFKINEKCITAKGDPVIFLGATKDKMIVKSIATGNENQVPLNYKLLPYVAEKVSGIAKALIDGGSKKKAGESKPKLSHKIDAYLVKNKHTITEIAGFLKDAPEAVGKNLRANIFARMVSYKRRGDRVVKKEGGLYEVFFKSQKTRLA